MLPRLIELLQSAPTDPEGNMNVSVIAKHLLANGVVVPVRCKDCKENPHYIRAKGMIWCRKFRTYVHKNGFCSYVEKGETDERN